jgi:CBS domain-containing protein
VSIAANAAVKEAAAFLVDRGYSAAPLIGEAGHPVGVLSQSDIVIHNRAKIEYVSTSPNTLPQLAGLIRRSPEILPEGFEVVDVDRTQVRDITTLVVFSVAPEETVHKVTSDMLDYKVHRLFVVDSDGVLVGIISTIDVLRHLRAE